MLQPETTRRFLHAYWGVRQHMLRRIGPVLRDAHGLETGELMLLEHVAGSDLSPTEIAAALALPAHTVSRRIGALEGRALLRRELDPDDARRRRLTLTAAGAAALAAGRATLHREVGAMLDVLEPNARTTFVDALERLAGGAAPGAERSPHVP